ncbi:MAG TPA: hypothetical protein VED46_17040 [Alphaproteobacteria bacterium]|nr:hypothetical protein [Alphaproteobacteria bacterium]
MSLKFFFSWENSTDFFAVINANAALIVRGICQANAVGGVFFGGWVNLGLTANLKVHLGGTVLQGPYASITTLTADTWGSAFFGDGDLKTANIYTTPLMSRKNILVQDHQLVIFEVSLDATYWIDSGSVTIEFSSQDRNVTCPALEIELLTAP